MSSSGITLPDAVPDEVVHPMPVVTTGKRRADKQGGRPKRKRSSYNGGVGGGVSSAATSAYDVPDMELRVAEDSILPPGMDWVEPPIMAKIEKRTSGGRLSTDERRSVFGGRAIFHKERGTMYVMLNSHEKPIMDHKQPEEVDNEDVVREQVLRCMHIALRSIDTKLGFNLLRPITFVLIDPPEAKTTTLRMRFDFMVAQIRTKNFKSVFSGVVVMMHECRQLGHKMDQRNNNTPVTTSGRTVRGIYHTLSIDSFVRVLPRVIFHDQIMAMIVNAWGYSKYGQAKMLPIVVPMNNFRDIAQLAARTDPGYYCPPPPSLAYQTTVSVRGVRRPSHPDETHTFPVETVRCERHAYGLEQNDCHVAGWLQPGDKLDPAEDNMEQRSTTQFISSTDLVRKLAIKHGINRDPDTIVVARMKEDLRKYGASAKYLLEELKMLQSESSAEEARVVDAGNGGPSLPVFGTVKTHRKLAPKKSVPAAAVVAATDDDLYDDVDLYDDEDESDDEEVTL